MNPTDPQTSSALAIHAQRRQYPRFPAQVPVDLCQEGGNSVLRMETRDLSRGGCSIPLMASLSVGSYVQITLWLNETPVGIRGRAVTRHPEFGNGIMFLKFQDGSEGVLARYLDAISQ